MEQNKLTPFKKIGPLKRSRALVKSSWGVLRLQKKLFWLPLLSLFATILFIMFLSLIIYLIFASGFIHTSVIKEASSSLKSAAFFFTISLIAICIGIINSFFTGAFIHGILEQFRGNNPTLGDCFRAARKRFIRLAVYIFISLGIGIIINEIANRIPFFGGRILSWLAGASWAVANVFSLQVIMDTDEPVSAFGPSKKSLKLLKKAWGESVLINVGLWTIILISITGMTIFNTLLLKFTIYGVSNPSIFRTLSFIIPDYILTYAVCTIFSAVSITIKTAIYYYSVTNTVPKNFELEILKSTITKKKARRIFR